MGVIYEIKRGSTVLASVEGKGERQEAIMGVDVVNMSFTLNTYVNFLKGDTCLINGQLFVLKAPSEFDRGGKWDYSLQFLSDPYTLGDIQVLAADEDNNLTEYDCPFTGTASEVMDLILLNANRLSSGWSKGVVDATETLDFDFTGDSCSTALAKLADTCKTEFWVVGKTIHLTKRGADSGLSFRHGKGLGLTKLIRKNTNSKLVTRLHVYGSTRNLPASYPGLSKRLRMPAGQLYIEDPAKVALYGRSEDTHVFEDIYPKRIGSVTAVTDAFTFTDTSLNFDINAQLIPGTSAKVKFVSGQLAGWEFDIRDNGYNHGTKAITINANKDEKAISVPSDTGLKPAVGDQYVLFDIIMPQAFIDAAESELLAKGQELYDSICDPQVQFEAPTDRRYLRDNGITVNLGDYVNIADTEAGIDNDIRVTSKITDLQDPNNVKLELSNTSSVSNIVRQLITEKLVQRVIKINNLADINRSRRNRKTSDETIGMMFDPVTGLVRNDKLDVGYIAAQAARFGTGSQDFQLSGIIFQPGETSLTWSGGQLLHNVLTDQNGIWTLAAGSETTLDNGTAYYVYAKVSKIAAIGTIMVSTSPAAFDNGDGFYYLWIGVLNSVIDGVRMLSTTYGITEINGRLLRTGEVANTAGDPVMDIDNRTFYGTFKFSDGRDAKVAVDATKEVTDNFTVIDGGVTMANTMKVGTAGVDVAGMTAVGADDNAIWLWGGTTFADRANANFRVNRAGKVWLSDAVVSGEINATSGTIAGVSISADDQFSLTGSKVKIKPDKGINVYGYFSGPKAAPALADMEVGEYYEYTRESGSGAIGSPGMGLFDLQGLQQVGSLTNGQVLKYNSASGKWENSADAGGGDLTQTIADGRYLGISATAANATKWGGLPVSWTQNAAMEGVVTVYNGTAYWANSASLRLFLALNEMPESINFKDTRTSASGFFEAPGISFTDYNGTFARIYAEHNFYFGSGPRALVLTGGGVTMRMKGGVFNVYNLARFSSHVDASLDGAFRIYDGTTLSGGVGASSWAFGAALGYSNLDFAVYAERNLIFGAGTVERMRMTSGGKLGIQTQIPNHELDVNLMHGKGVQFAGAINNNEWNHVTLGYTQRNGLYEKVRFITQRLDDAARQDLNICVNVGFNSASATLSDARVKIDGTNGAVHIISGFVAPVGPPATADMKVGVFYEYNRAI